MVSGREFQDRGGICILLGDACCCMAETNTIGNYLSDKNKLKKKNLKKKKKARADNTTKSQVLVIGIW